MQVVEDEKMRALSLNGYHWEIQYLHVAPSDFWGAKMAQQTTIKRYARIALWNEGSGLKRLSIDPRLPLDDIEQHCDAVLHCLENIKPPLPLNDHFELWLLDEADKKPLALLSTCQQREETTANKPSTRWYAISAAEIDLPNTDEEMTAMLPPVSYRLEQIVKRRAGQNPRAKWFLRAADGSGSLFELEASYVASDFPAMLLREEWPDAADQALCQRYLTRMAPRLLLLQNLSATMRDQIEASATAYACDVARYFHLYPEIINEKRMTTIRVEARLRDALGDRMGR